MSARQKKLGAWGEEQAASYLAEHGYTILDKNYRWARGELDIVAEKGGVLVFVEVKTAASATMGEPENWVTLRKQKQIAMVAQRYLQEKQIEDRDCRFDVIGIMKRGEKAHIKHIENAFWLEAEY